MAEDDKSNLQKTLEDPGAARRQRFMDESPSGGDRRAQALARLDEAIELLGDPDRSDEARRILEKIRELLRS